jgi:hypothetical protein
MERPKYRLFISNSKNYASLGEALEKKLRDLFSQFSNRAGFPALNRRPLNWSLIQKIG